MPAASALGLSHSGPRPEAGPMQLERWGVPCSDACCHGLAAASVPRMERGKAPGTASPAGSRARLWVEGLPRGGRRLVMGRPRQVCGAPLPMVGLGALRQAQTLSWSPTTLVQPRPLRLVSWPPERKDGAAATQEAGPPAARARPRPLSPLTLLPGGAACASVKEAAPLRGSSAPAGQPCLPAASSAVSVSPASSAGPPHAAQSPRSPP